MTAFAFILGVLPLVDLDRSRRQLTADPRHDGPRWHAGATLIAVFIIPVTFYVSERLGRRTEKQGMPTPALAPISGGVNGDSSTEASRR